MPDLIVTMVAAEQLDDLNAYVVVLSEQADGTGERIEFQRALSFDDQDRELGQDTYCICVASGATTYGGVRACILSGLSLRLRLSPEAADELGSPQEVEVELRTVPEALVALREGLLRIFPEGRDRPGEFALPRLPREGERDG